MTDRAPCKHYWIIPDSTKETVTGVCKLCGEKKPDMQNQWGFHGTPREAIREWQLEEHLKKEGRNHEMSKLQQVRQL